MKWGYVYLKYKELVFESLEILKVNNPRILKTDLHNEVNDSFFFFGSGHEDITFVEIDKELCDKAKKLFPSVKIENGDIRKLKFEDNSFDFIADLSTIDHVMEYQIVLDGYKRIFSDRGILLLISWLADKERYETCQSFFNKEEFIDELEKRFRIIKQKDLTEFVNRKDGYLTAFICEVI
jgi:hypothetical protein